MSKRWITVTSYPSHSCHYYRLVVGVGQRTLYQQHVPGGRVGNPIVERRVEELRTAIATGQSVEEVLALVERWGV